MKIKFKKFKNKISRIPKILAQKSFLFFLFLFLIFLLISVFLFWKYEISLKEKEVSPIQVRKFNRAKLEKILKIWQERREEFEKIEEKKYKDPFSLP